MLSMIDEVHAIVSSRAVSSGAIMLNTEQTTLDEIHQRITDVDDPAYKPEKDKIEAHVQALAEARLLGDRREEAMQLAHIAFAHFSLLEQPESAIAYYEQALCIFREIHDPGMEARTLGSLGMVYLFLQELKRAVEYKQQAIRIYSAIDDRDGEIDQLTSLGLLYGKSGFSEKAILYFKKALALTREIRSRQKEAVLLSNIGVTYAEMHQEKHAFEHLELARNIFHEIGNRQEELDTLQSMGTLHVLRGQAGRGIQLYEAALALCREIARDETEADLLQSLGRAWQRQKEYERALEYYQAAVEMYDRLGSPSAGYTRERLEACRRLANKKWWEFWLKSNAAPGMDLTSSHLCPPMGRNRLISQ
jgi:tetratricopeptide (TPR) repeat protein